MPYISLKNDLIKMDEQFNPNVNRTLQIKENEVKRSQIIVISWNRIEALRILKIILVFIYLIVNWNVEQIFNGSLILVKFHWYSIDFVVFFQSAAGKKNDRHAVRLRFL